MSVVINSLTVDCHDPKALAEFWTAALGWHVVDESDEGVMIAPFPSPSPASSRSFSRRTPTTRSSRTDGTSTSRR